jgi:hypothetical protein
MAAYFDRPPSLEEMRASGYEPEDFEGEEFAVWPENWPAIRLFASVQTQWRVGFGGATGLDYPAVFATMDRMLRNETQERKDALFRDLQVVERAALDEMSKAAKKSR